MPNEYQSTPHIYILTHHHVELCFLGSNVKKFPNVMYMYVRLLCNLKIYGIGILLPLFIVGYYNCTGYIRRQYTPSFMLYNPCQRTTEKAIGRLRSGRVAALVVKTD